MGRGERESLERRKGSDFLVGYGKKRGRIARESGNGKNYCRAVFSFFFHLFCFACDELGWVRRRGICPEKGEPGGETVFHGK
jgi:hypothetical protein